MRLIIAAISFVITISSIWLWQQYLSLPNNELLELVGPRYTSTSSSRLGLANINSKPLTTNRSIATSLVMASPTLFFSSSISPKLPRPSSPSSNELVTTTPTNSPAFLTPLAYLTHTPTPSLVSNNTSTSATNPTPKPSIVSPTPLLIFSTPTPTASPTESPITVSTTNTPDPSSSPESTPPPTTPTPTATTLPTPTPLPDQSTTNYTISALTLTSPLSRGSTAELKISTAEGAQCALTVTLPSGSISGAKDIASSQPLTSPKSVDASGILDWTWKIGGSTKPGTASLGINCTEDASSFRATLQMEITE